VRSDAAAVVPFEAVGPEPAGALGYVALGALWALSAGETNMPFLLVTGDTSMVAGTSRDFVMYLELTPYGVVRN
jgi:hypothetical protein